MQIKSIVAGAAITLFAGVGSVSAEEIYVAGSKEAPATAFAAVIGLPIEQMSVQAMADTRGAGIGTGSSEYLLSSADLPVGDSMMIIGFNHEMVSPRDG